MTAVWKLLVRHLFSDSILPFYQWFDHFDSSNAGIALCFHSTALVVDRKRAKSFPLLHIAYFHCDS